jgi:hypothetical protein
MKTLTVARIIELSDRRGAESSYVFNFLSTLDGLTYEEAKANLQLDAKSFGWNTATVDAIRTGILERGVR